MRRRRATGYYENPTPPFPASVVPTVWFDGNQRAFSDFSATTPVDSGLIRRINEPVAQAGAWTTPSDPERPYRDPNAVRFELVGSAGGYEMTRAGVVSGIAQNSCTLVASFVARDCANGCPGMGVVRTDDLRVGFIVSQILWVYHSGGSIWFTSLPIVQGVENIVIIEYLPTSIVATVKANGAATSQTLSITLSSAAVTGTWRLGLTGSSYFYGSIPQVMGIARPITFTEKAALMAWVDAQNAPAAYPDDRALLAFVGDSITRGVAATYSFAYPFVALTSIRSTKPLTEVCNTATPGIGANGLILAGAGTTYYEANRFYSALRIKNVMVVALGSNDLSGTNSTQFFLDGTGPPGTPGSGIYPLCDAARATGWKVVLVGVPPRSGSLSVSQATYDAKRDAVNADMAANWTAHADAFVDVRPITNYGANGDSANLTYYADAVHPTNAGHALLAPYVAAAILTLL